MLAFGATLALASASLALAHGPPSHEREDVVTPRLLPGPPARPPALPFRVEGQKRLYIANDDHTDYFWTADDVAYRSAFQAMLDYYMAQAESSAANPSDARGRFNCDGSLWVREYEAHRTLPEFQRLIDHLRAGDITMPLNTLVLLYGAMPTEAVLRNMYYAGRLERREDLRFQMVVPQENQTLPGGVASLWAGSGARYSWKGICGCASRIDAADRPRDIYRFTGPDGQSVIMKWNGFFGSQSIGGYAEARNPTAAVTRMDSDPAFLARWPWGVAGAFGYGWDEFETFTDRFLQASQDLSDSTRRVIVSNELDFFQDFEDSYGAQLSSFSGSFGNEWDLYTASMGELTASFKRELEKLRTAEALASIASLDDPSFMSGRESARDSAFMACGLYYEHSWTADGLVPKSVRAQWERSMQRALATYVETLYSDALARVASRVAAPAGFERHMVFNPLSWTRTDFADLDVATPAPFHVVDVVTGLEVPSQSVIVAGQPRVRILASAVPAVGYRTFEVRSGVGASFPPAATVSLPSLDNGTYLVKLGARGQLLSVLDHKDGDRELVDAAGGGAINDIGTSGSGSVTLENSGPVSTTLRVAVNATPSHETRVTLYSSVDRIDIENRVTQNFTLGEGYDSRFNLPGCSMRHEEVGMIARVARAADGGDYADVNTRTDYLTFNHFVDLSQPTRGVTMSNWDSQFFRAGNSTLTVLDGTTPSISAVVGMQVDGPGLGIQNQGGDTLFLNRYSLRTHGGYDSPSAMRFALEHQNPLVAARVTGNAGAPLPESSWSLVSIGSPDILLWALKPAEEGIDHGLIARVWNLADSTRDLSLALPTLGIGSASRTTHIETDLSPAPLLRGVLTDVLAPQQLRTYRLFTASTTSSPPRPASPPLAFEIMPNPIRGGAAGTLAINLAASGPVRIELHDLRAARVATLFDGFSSAGRQLVPWIARAKSGERLAPGIYFVRVEAGGRSVSRRVVILR